MENKVD
jgi:geranylgeranyl transferase type-2 subunit beta